MSTTPTGAKLVGAFAGLSGFLSLLDAPLWFARLQAFPLLAVVLFGFTALLGLLFLVAGAGLYLGRGWGRLMGLALFVFDAVLSVVALALAGGVGVVLGLLVDLLVLGYLYRTPDAFGGAEHADIDESTSAHEIGAGR